MHYDKTRIHVTYIRVQHNHDEKKKHNDKVLGTIYIYIYGYWVVSGPHGTAFINCTCMFEGSYIYLPSTHI